jgi:glycosyltransferase involved in cell wall biosynthesis
MRKAEDIFLASLRLTGYIWPMRVSAAVPLYNEEAALPELLERLRTVLDGIPGGPHEIVVVDDGSSDRTGEILRGECARDNRLVGIIFSRNFGHQAALTAALDQITGDVAILMDGDLQDPPEVIPQFIEKYEQGYDVVYAQRVQRKEAWWLRFCYHVFYRAAARLSGSQLPLDAGDFALMSRRVTDEIRRMPEYHRYLRGMRAWVGFRQTGIPVERAERYAGKPKYTLIKLIKLAADGIFSFSIIPLRFAAVVGVSAISLSVIYAACAIYLKLFRGQTPQGFTALIVSITFLAGVQLFFMGIIGEYVGRLFEASKSRPNYIVAERLGGASQNFAPDSRSDAARAYANRL